MENHNQIQYVIDRDDLKEILSEIIDERIEYIIETWTETNKSDGMVSSAKAAQLLGVSKTTLWRWNKCGYLKPIRVGGNDRYRLRDINRILK